jgi:hypothetical protein
MLVEKERREDGWIYNTPATHNTKVLTWFLTCVTIQPTIIAAKRWLLPSPNFEIGRIVWERGREKRESESAENGDGEMHLEKLSGENLDLVIEGRSL